MKKIQACALIFILFFAFSIATVPALADSLSFGGRSGDWIEYELQNDMQVVSGETSDVSVTISFLNVEDSNFTLNVTQNIAGVTIPRETTIDLTSNSTEGDILFPQMFNLRAYFIPLGLNVSDPVYLGQLFGTQTITGETTETYSDVTRTVLFANFTMQGSQYILYWDKQTGILTEGLQYVGNETNVAAYNDVLVSDTNMWSPPIIWPLLFWIAIALVIALGVWSSRKKSAKKAQGKTNNKPDLTKINSFSPLKIRKRKVNRNTDHLKTGATFISNARC